MNEDTKRMMYQTIDSLSAGERQQLIAYLEASSQHHRVCDIVTQEELDMLYATTLDIEAQNKRIKNQ
ncbi:hypothetical protein ACRZ5S_16805 [Vibrio scophthalmi]|uniref:Uncharacterized protein n=1 Tax=Vibrio scophthalmi TaxID=45658 RepID=A0A1E3WH44_9VIBR|nr:MULTISPECIES: hypothetical protein [Vibrio]EGU36008.1 hypothetical protein VIBRN418_08467 [Vibrio sp. N418]MCY9803708.1 hypothetical protein [Vibrio scophthalmi]ODS04357.1 hypothetical protein VSF3289_03488 [Vibrio scophthalmi]